MRKRKRQKLARARARATVKCRKCGEEFQQVLAGVWYCSAQCERLAANPVARFFARFKIGSGVHTDKKKLIPRKEKHKNVEL